MKVLRCLGVAVLLWAECGGASAAGPSGVECLAPAAPGGGWDFTCRAVAEVLVELGLVSGPVKVRNLPGEGGGLAYRQVVTRRNADSNRLVAASTATTTRLAQDRYGGLAADQVRWVASLGADFGVIAVAAHSPVPDLRSLMRRLATEPASVRFGGGSAAGGWDHLKVLQLARSAQVKPLGALVYRAFPGGGAAVQALLEERVDVFSGDLSELVGLPHASRLRILAVLADQRLPERFAHLPTAREQGYDVVGANWRGFYVGGEVPAEAYRRWVRVLDQVYQSPQWRRAMMHAGLVPFWNSGEEFESFVRQQVAALAELSREIGLLQ